MTLWAKDGCGTTRVRSRDELVHRGLPAPRRPRCAARSTAAAARVCDVTGDHVRTSSKEVDVVFNNPIGASDKELLSHVTVSPWVKNLRVRHEYWDGSRLSITGELLPFDALHLRHRRASPDAYGGSLAKPVTLAVDTTPLPVSLSMPEGSLLLDSGSEPDRAGDDAQREEDRAVDLGDPRGDDLAAFRHAVGAGAAAPDARRGPLADGRLGSRPGH